jgi:hypothetical protein
MWAPDPSALDISQRAQADAGAAGQLSLGDRRASTVPAHQLAGPRRPDQLCDHANPRAWRILAQQAQFCRPEAQPRQIKLTKKQV